MTTPIPRTPLAPIAESTLEAPHKPCKKSNNTFSLDPKRIQKLSDTFQHHHKLLMETPDPKI